MVSQAAGDASATNRVTQSQNERTGREPYNTGWSFYLDNDLLSLLSRDQQYTGGAALTLSGRRAVEYPWSLDGALSGLDELGGFAHLYERERGLSRHSFEIGLTTFTPEDISKSEPIPDDHPYASLVFMSNTQQCIHLDTRVSYQSTLALGLLGTDVSKEVQEVFHSATGSEQPKGWDNQISDGGEPTFNYVVNRQQPFILDADRVGIDYDVRTTLGASLGYTTQLQAGINWRWGRIRTPWWGFNPDFAEYVNLGTPVKYGEA